MRRLETEQAIADLLPQLKKHLEHSLSPQLLERFAVDDIVHDTYVRAVERLDTLMDTRRASMIAWLQRIAHRLLIDKIRRKQNQQVNGREASALYAGLIASGQMTASHECSTQEAARSLEVAIAELNHDCREVIRLRYAEGLTFAAISRAMDRSPAVVRGLHQNAIQQLKRGLGRASLYFSD